MDVVNLLKTLLITAAVILICLSPLYLVEWLYRAKAKKMFRELPAEVQKTLADPANFKGADRGSRLKYIKKSLILGGVILLLNVGWGVIRMRIDQMKDVNVLSTEGLMVGAAVLFVFILLFVMRDLFRVAPWSEAYELPAAVCFKGGKNRDKCYVCFYDFFRGQFSTGVVMLSADNRAVSAGMVVSALTVGKRKKLKLIDLID